MADTTPTVQVPLDVLESLLESAVASAVNTSLGGLPQPTRGVLFHRLPQIVGLSVSRVQTGLAASGYINRPAAQPELLG